MSMWITGLLHPTTANHTYLYVNMVATDHNVYFVVSSICFTLHYKLATYYQNSPFASQIM